MLLYLTLYCLAVVAVSLVGGWVPIYVRLTHRRMQLANSLVAGFMLGVALLILLPHGLMAVPIGTAVAWLIVGLLAMFFLERFFCYHHHDVPPGVAIEADHRHLFHEVPLPQAGPEKPAPAGAEDPDHHAHHHTHAHDHPHDTHKLSWTGAATGLVLHSLIDGIALAAAVYAEPVLNHGSLWPGLAVFLVVALHRPLDSMTLLTLTAGEGWTQARRHLLNGLFALAVPAGAALFLLGLGGAGVEHSAVAGYALSFAAGVFLCVSLSDLLPELQFHSHDRVPLSAALLIGLGLAFGVQRLETAAHDHGHHPHAGPEQPAPADAEAPDHISHDHPH